MDVLAAAGRLEAAGRRIVHMEVGQPSAAAPAAARARLSAALEQPLGYTEALGLPALRAEIARLYRRRHGLDVDPARVILTTGSSAGFQLAFLALFDPGERLAMAEPGYPSYRQIATALGLEAVRVEGALDTRHQPTTEQLDAAGALDGLLVASPANPTGSMLSRAALAELVDWCERVGAALIVDEIYHGLHFETPAETVLALSDDAIVINSFSKYFCMTGWRIGWMIAPERFVGR